MSLQGKVKPKAISIVKPKHYEQSNRKIKLNHWLNIRKTTIEVLNELLSKDLNYEINFENLDEIDERVIKKIGSALSIPVENILIEDDNS